MSFITIFAVKYTDYLF